MSEKSASNGDVNYFSSFYLETKITVTLVERVPEFVDTLCNNIAYEFVRQF
jgi:hypothetical protein